MWVALIGLIAVAVGSVLALLGVRLTTRATRTEGAKARTHEADMAEKAARREIAKLRLERHRTAYLEILLWVERKSMELVVTIRKSEPPPRDGPDMMSATIEILSRLDCTPGFVAEVDRWARAYRETTLLYEHWYTRECVSGANVRSAGDAGPLVEAYQGQIQKARGRLMDRARADLDFLSTQAVTDPPS